MTGIATFLLAMCGPLVVRAIIALTFTVVTFSGVTGVVDQLNTLAQGYWSAMPVAVLQLASLSGIPQSLGIIMGAYAARMAMWTITSGTRYVAKAP